MINVCTRKSNRFSFLSLQIGPGIVYLTFHSPIGSGTFVQHLVPTEPLVQKLVHNLYFQKNLPAFIGKFFLLGEAIQVRYFFLKLGLTLFFRITYLFLFAKKNLQIQLKYKYKKLFFMSFSARKGYNDLEQQTIREETLVCQIQRRFSSSQTQKVVFSILL